MVRYCQTVRRYDKSLDNGNGRCRSVSRHGVGRRSRCSQVVHCRVAWEALEGYPTACPMQPYLDYKYILPHLPKYVKLNISIFSCFFKVSLRRKMYISRRTQRQIIRIFIIFYYCLSGGALKLKSVNFLTIQLSTDNSRH